MVPIADVDCDFGSEIGRNDEAALIGSSQQSDDRRRSGKPNGPLGDISSRVADLPHRSENEMAGSILL